MNKSYGQGDADISGYVEKICQPEKENLWKKIRQSATDNDIPGIHVGPMDGQHLEVLVSAMNVNKAVEIGTLVGYSGIRILRGMKPTSRLYTFEYSELHAEVARTNFLQAGFASQVELIVGPALSNLNTINRHGPFDLVFIDADKVNYPNYFKWAKANLRSGGVLIADNVFAWGSIVTGKASDPEQKKSVMALQEFNLLVTSDYDFATTILPTAEGLLLALKK